MVCGPATAKEPQYLLNCRLIDQNTDLWQRYCKGEEPDAKVVCQGDFCIIVVKKYVGRFGGKSEMTLAVPDGPAINDGIATASVSALPGPGPTDPEPEGPTDPNVGNDDPDGNGEPGTRQ